MTEKISATVVTGFLGAGKTTLIRHMLQHAGGRRLALIINEFGDIGIDGALLGDCGEASCSAEDIVELANGCICCTVADDFLPAMQALLDRSDPPDHIVIETSGLALPKPLVQAFNWPEIRTRVTVDGVVAVVDAAAVAEGRFAADPAALAAQRAADPNLDHDSPLEELFEDQLACADMVILNKSDLLVAADREAVRQSVGRQIRAGVKMVSTEHGRMDLNVLMGLGAGAEADLANRPSHHDNELEHDHDDFASFSVALPEIASPDALLARLTPLIATHDVLRVKGFLAVAGKPMRLVLQGVGSRLQHYYDRDWRTDEPRRSTLVVIGNRGLDEAAIRAGLGA